MSKNKFVGQINLESGSFEFEKVTLPKEAVRKDEESSDKDIVYMTPRDLEMYGSYEGWNHEVFCRSFFNSNLELIAEYATYKNYLRGLTVVKKYQKSFLKIGLKAEIALANAACAELRKIDEEKRLKETQKFIKTKKIDEKVERLEKDELLTNIRNFNTTTNNTTNNTTIVVKAQKVDIKDVVEKTLSALLSGAINKKELGQLEAPVVQEPILFVKRAVGI